MGDDAVDGTF